MTRPTLGRYSLTQDGIPLLNRDGESWWETYSLEDARYAARMACGATIIRWQFTPHGGTDSEIVESIPAPDWIRGDLDLTRVPGRYLVRGTIAEFREACRFRGLGVSCAYRCSGPSLLVTSQDGWREYSFREYEWEWQSNELIVRQYPL